MVVFQVSPALSLAQAGTGGLPPSFLLLGARGAIVAIPVAFVGQRGRNGEGTLSTVARHLHE